MADTPPPPPAPDYGDLPGPPSPAGWPYPFAPADPPSPFGGGIGSTSGGGGSAKRDDRPSLAIEINLGGADNADVHRLLAAINDLYESLGGPGLEFDVDELDDEEVPA